MAKNAMETLNNMCLYPKLIDNPKYKKNRKNGGVIPAVNDKRAYQVPIGCQKCMECRGQKSREWQVRLMEDIKENKNGKFITLTFSDKSLIELGNEIDDRIEGYDLDNAIATRAVRKFMERWRWHHKKSLRHWLVTELGPTNTERLHIHGIIWTDEPKSEIEKIWQYGNMGWKKTWREERNYVNGASITYIVKYINEADEKHPNYIPKILTSPGIGQGYEKTAWAKINQYKGKDTKDEYRLNTGHKTALPIYYRNKIYNDAEKESLWMNRLDKNERYVNGIRIDVSKGYEKYYEVLEAERKKNKRLGFGGEEGTWEQEIYEKQLRNAKVNERAQKQTDTRTNHNDNQKRNNTSKPLGKHSNKPKQKHTTENGTGRYEEQIKRIAKELGINPDQMESI